MKKFPEIEIIIYAGNRFDSNIIRKFANLYNLKYLAYRMRSVYDIGIEMDRMMMSSFPKGGLKPLAKHLGFNWKTKFNGEIVAYIFTQYQLNKIEPNNGWDELLNYNQDDVMGLKYVIENLLELKNRRKRDISVND